MTDGHGGGNIIQSMYSFEVLTGQTEGDDNIKDRDKEESFYGAGSWK
jgi:hypothetical protein